MMFFRLRPLAFLRLTLRIQILAQILAATASASGIPSLTALLPDEGVQKEQAIIECGVDSGFRWGSAGRIKICLMRTLNVRVAEEPLYVLRVQEQDRESQDFTLQPFYPDQQRSWRAGREVLKSTLVNAADDKLVVTEVILESGSRSNPEDTNRTLSGVLPEGGRFKVNLRPALSTR